MSNIDKMIAKLDYIRLERRGDNNAWSILTDFREILLAGKELSPTIDETRWLALAKWKEELEKRVDELSREMKWHPAEDKKDAPAVADPFPDDIDEVVKRECKPDHQHRKTIPGYCKTCLECEEPEPADDNPYCICGELMTKCTCGEPSEQTLEDKFSPQSIDAMDWANEYCRLNKSADHGNMLAWFASSIMAGFDEATRRSHSNPDKIMVDRKVAEECVKFGTPSDHKRLNEELRKALSGK